MSTTTTHKRKRAPSPSPSTRQPPTPPLAASDPDATCLLSRATNVLSTAATALSHISMLYETDVSARAGLVSAVEIVTSANRRGGKLLICGVGKSGLVARKTVATMKSLGVGCSFLHAGEAMHGDLGDIGKNDALMFLSYSGRTPELLSLLPHIPPTTPIIALTSHTVASHCPLLTTAASRRQHAVLLPAPIHESEEKSFGVCAPTTSTTVAIAVGDMLALSVAEALHADTRKVFARNHPGGAIGAQTHQEQQQRKQCKAMDPESSTSVEVSTPNTIVQVAQHDGLITPPAV